MDSDKHKHDNNSVDEDIDLNINFNSIKKIFTSNLAKKLLIAFLILIPVILTIYIRLLPWEMPATDNWAQNSVDNYYKNNIAQQVNSQYPNLPAQQKQKLIDEQYLQFQKTNTEQLKAQVQQTSEYFKSGFQYQENGNTYTFLGDLDSYFFLRQARNLESKGMVCDEIKDGLCWDNHMYAPLGSISVGTMHPYGFMYLHKILHTFNPKINLMQAAFLLPTLLAAIAAIAAFFIGRRLMNNVAGFFAAMFITLSPMFISRTLGSDTDIWNIMFPLIILWLFLEAFEEKSMIKKSIYTSLAGLFIGLFAFAWSGWWYIFDFIVAAIIAYIAILMIKNYYNHKHYSKILSKEVNHNAIMLGILLISATIFIALFNGTSTNIVQAFNIPIQMLHTVKAAVGTNIWPNVQTTVAELNEAGIGTIVSQTSFGINILFGLALLGIILSMIKKNPDFKEYVLIGFSAIIFIFLSTSTKGLNLSLMMYILLISIPIIIAVLMYIRDKESIVDLKPGLLLTIWFVGMIFSSTKGVRFILLLVPAFSIALSVTLGYLFHYLTQKLSSGLNIKGYITKIIVFLVLCLVLIMPLQIGIATGKNYMPSMTTGWWDSLTKIREESKPDAIINSWWDFGHWFKYVADRKVSLDGSGQAGQQAHWLGKMLQTNNEDETVAILRMLDCGSNSAFDEIDKKYEDTEISQNIVAKIILLDKKDAKKELQKYEFSDQEIETILKFTHCEPPENYLVTSGDMVGKAGVWAHFGLWDFDKAFIIKNIRGKSLNEATQIMKERWNYTDDEATRIYYEIQALQTDRENNDWISPWPSYASGSMIPCLNVSEVVVCVLNIGIGSNGQQNIILERAIINTTNPADSVFHVIYQDVTSGNQIGENFIGMRDVIISDKTLTKYAVNDSGVDLSVLLDVTRENNQTQYRALVANSLLIDSTFTKLFYLDGKHMDSFEKFSDITDMTGTRIIVWKVKW